MKTNPAGLFATVLLTAFWPGSAAPAQTSPPITVSGCHALDGDTLRCGSVRIRLVGVDAAELPGHCRTGRHCAPGDPAVQRAALARLAAGRLTIVPIQLDKYQRMVARVRNAAGQDLSCAMIMAGATYRPDWDDKRAIARTCPTLVGNR